MYSEKVMDHFQNPRNVGEIEDASGVGTVGNAKCGDIMRMFLDIDENGIIREAKFKTFGCGAAVATSSMATELVKGKTLLVIAHRLNTIQNADQILVISDGQISQHGTHEELMEQPGIYQDFVRIRMNSAGWSLS
mgnify:CR=1 FL=1